MTVDIEVENFAERAVSVTVYNEGKTALYRVGTPKFQEICASWGQMVDGARQMPAFGVSLHAETVKEIKRGVWVEFDYGKTYECGGLPFERLILKVQSDWTGFNMVRYTAEFGYDGRCLYFDLVGRDMSEFERVLVG